MPNEKTRADSLRLYLTGAASDGAAQTDPDASLGGYRSSSLETFFTHTISNAIAGVTVDFISGAHSEGSGTLAATTSDTLAWTPPSGTQGYAVTIANGETKILEGGSAPGQFVRVSRTSATALSGTATVTLSLVYNNAIGGDNVTSAEAESGDTEYRALMLRNESAYTVRSVKAHIKTLGTQLLSGAAQLGASGAGSVGVSAGTFADWPTTGFCRIETSAGALREIVYYSSRTSSALTIPTEGRALLGTTAAAGASTDKIYPVPGLRIAKEAPASSAIQTVADEDTAPTGATWSSAITAATGLDLGDMAAGAMYGLWIERSVIVGAISAAEVEAAIGWSFDAV